MHSSIVEKNKLLNCTNGFIEYHLKLKLSSLLMIQFCKMSFIALGKHSSPFDPFVNEKFYHIGLS